MTPSIYPHDFLKTLKKLRTVTSITANIYNAGDLVALNELKSLTMLNLAMNGEGITSWSSLKGLPQLTTLNLDMTRQPDMQNINWLQELPRLTALTLNIGPNSRPVEIGALGKLKNLTHLTLNLNFNITDITPLQALKNLTFLNLDLIRSSQINNVNALKGLTSLSTLHLRLPSTDGRTFDISALGELTNLATLNLDFAWAHGKITDSSVLKNLTKLQSLAMHGNLATDGSYLGGFKGLSKLDIKQTGFTLKSLPENVTDLSVGSYATEVDWKILDLWD